MYSHLTKQLNEIDQEVLSGANPYNLSFDERKNFDIVLNTLRYISEEASNPHSKFNELLHKDTPGSMYAAADMSRYAIIHFEEFKNISKEKRIDFIVGSLVTTFIDSFRIAKEEGRKTGLPHVKTFAEKTGGVCIDARTRSAFDFALSLGKAPTFSKIMGLLSGKLEKASGEINYFGLFQMLLTDKWGEPFSESKEPHSEIEKKEGAINSDKLKQIEEYLSSVLYLIPDKEFLSIYKSPSFKLLPKEKKSVFYKFILQHEGLLDEIEEDITDEIEKNDLNQFMIVALIHENKISDIQKYLEKMTPEKFMSILDENISFEVFNELSSEDKIKFLELINTKFIGSPNLLYDFYLNSAFVNDEPFIKQLIQNDQGEIIAWVLEQKTANITLDTVIQKAIETSSAGTLYAVSKNNRALQYKIIQLIQASDKRDKISLIADYLSQIELNEKDIVSMMIDVMNYTNDNINLIRELCKKLLEKNISNDANDPVLIILEMYSEKTKNNILDGYFDTDRNTILHLAAKYNRAVLVKQLLDAGANKDAQNIKSQKPIITAITSYSFQAISALLKTDINQNDFDDILLFSAEKGESKLAHTVLSKTRSLRGFSVNGLSALHYAIIHNDIQLADAIQQMFNNINITIGNGHKTPWISVAECKTISEDTMRWLLKQPLIDVFYTYNGKSAFKIAHERNNPIFDRMLEMKDNPFFYRVARYSNEMKSDDINKLYQEVYLYTKSLDKLILGLKGKITNKAYLEYINTFILKYAEKIIETNDVKLLAFLISQKPDIINNVYDKELNSLLHLAAKSNKPDIIQVLLNSGCELSTLNNAKQTPMHIASIHNSWESVNHIASASNTDSKDTFQYREAMLRSVKEKKHDVSMQLLYANSDLDVGYNVDNEYYNIIYYIVLNNDIELLNAIYVKTKFNFMNKFDKTELSKMISALSNVDVTEETLQWVIENNALDLNITYNNQTLFEHLIDTNQFEKITLLLQNNSVAIQDLINIQLKEGKYYFVAGLLGHIYKNDRDGFSTYINEAIQSTNIDLIPVLIKSVLKIVGKNILSNDDRITLIKLNQSLYMKSDKLSIANIAVDDNNNTLLHLAAEYKKYDLFQELLSLGADISMLNAHNQSVFSIAAAEGSYDILNKLLESKIVQEMKMISDGGRTMALLAKKLDYIDIDQVRPIILKLLLKDIPLSFAIDDDNVKLQLIHYAVKNSEFDMVKIILEKTHEPNSRADSNSPTPLILAMQDLNVQTDIIIYLMKQKGIDFSIKYNDKTALDYCLENKNFKIYQKLFEPGDTALQIDILTTQIKNSDFISASILLGRLFDQNPKCIIPLLTALREQSQSDYQQFSATFFKTNVVSILNSSNNIELVQILYNDKINLAIDNPSTIPGLDNSLKDPQSLFVFKLCGALSRLHSSTLVPEDVVFLYQSLNKIHPDLQEKIIKTIPDSVYLNTLTNLVEKGDAASFQLILEKKKDLLLKGINTQNDTLLHLAARNNKSEIVKIILEQKMNDQLLSLMNESHETPVVTAMSNLSLEALNEMKSVDEKLTSAFNNTSQIIQAIESKQFDKIVDLCKTNPTTLLNVLNKKHNEKNLNFVIQLLDQMHRTNTMDDSIKSFIEQISSNDLNSILHFAIKSENPFYTRLLHHSVSKTNSLDEVKIISELRDVSPRYFSETLAQLYAKVTRINLDSPAIKSALLLSNNQSDFTYIIQFYNLYYMLAENEDISAIKNQINLQFLENNTNDGLNQKLIYELSKSTTNNKNNRQTTAVMEGILDIVHNRSVIVHQKDFSSDLVEQTREYYNKLFLIFENSNVSRLTKKLEHVKKLAFAFIKNSITQKEQAEQSSILKNAKNLPIFNESLIAKHKHSWTLFTHKISAGLSDSQINKLEKSIKKGGKK